MAPWTWPGLPCHSSCHDRRTPRAESDVRPGEVAVALPLQPDAGVFFIGTIRTPWRSRAECPKRGSPDGPVCSIVVDERWRLRSRVWPVTGASRFSTGCISPGAIWCCRRRFAAERPPAPLPCARRCGRIRSHPRSSMLVAVTDATVEVRGLDCLDGTPLIDIKPERTIARRIATRYGRCRWSAQMRLA